MEIDSVVRCRGLQTGTHIGCGHGDRATKFAGCGQGFDHRGRQVMAERPVALLKVGHRPRHLPEAQELDLVRQRNKLGAKPCLQLGSQTNHGRRQLADNRWVGEGAAESEQPQTGGGESRRESPEIRWSFSGQDIAKEMVVDDDRAHSRGREVGVVKLFDEIAVVLRAERLGEETLPAARR